METTKQTEETNSSWKSGFWSLIGVQFQGAFSDNMLKWLVTFLVLGGAMEAAERDRLVVLVIPLLFAIPFLLFSMAGGYLADRYSKKQVTIGTKLLEIVVAVLALGGLWSGSLTLDCAAIFLISVQAALFGPSKYGLLPELLPEKRLSWGNGILELGTFVAIITGTMVAGVLADQFRGEEQWPGMLLLALAGVGLVVSFGISEVPAANPAKRLEWNPVADLWGQIERMKRDRLLSLAVAGNTFFWFLGALVLINTALYATDVLHVSETETSILMAAMSIGIGVGSFAAGYFSGKKIEYGLVPIGAVGIAATMILLSQRGLTFSQTAWELGWTGFFGGFFAVPLNALIQYRPQPEEKGGIIAAANLLSFVGIALQPVAQYLLIFFGHPSPARTFLLTGVLTLIATAIALALQPDSLLRLWLWAATHTAWPLRVEGSEQLPQRGPAVLLLPRVRTSDLFWLFGSTDRTMRILLPAGSVEGAARWLKPIPFPATGEGRRRAARAAKAALDRDEVVCVPADEQDLLAETATNGAPVLEVMIDARGPFSRTLVRLEPGSSAPCPSIAPGRFSSL